MVTLLLIILFLSSLLFNILFYNKTSKVLSSSEPEINKKYLNSEYKKTLSRSLSLVIQDIEDQLHYYDDIRQNGTEKEELEAYRNLKNYIHTKERIVQNELNNDTTL